MSVYVLKGVADFRYLHENMSEEKKDNNYYEETPLFEANKTSKLREHISKGFGAFLIVAAAIICYFVFLRFSFIFDKFLLVIDVLRPVIYGVVIAYLLSPIVKKIDKILIPFLKNKIKIQKKYESVSRGLSVLCAELFMVLLVFLLFYLIIPEVYSSIESLVYTLPTLVNNAMLAISEISFDNPELQSFVTTTVENSFETIENWLKTDLLSQMNSVMSNLTVGVIGVVVVLFDIIMGVIISIYLLLSKELFLGQLKKLMYALFPVRSANTALHIAHKSNKIFGGFIIGKLIDSMIVGILCFIGLSILNMPYTLLISVIIGVTNIIPFFGPYIGAVPCGLLLFLTDPMLCLYFVFFILFLQQLDGNVIGPKILGESTGLSSFWVIFAILVGGGLFGFAGMVIGVPTFAVIYYIAGLFVDHRLECKELPIITEYYKEGSYVDTQTGDYVGVDDEETKEVSDMTVDEEDFEEEFSDKE